MVTTNGGCSSKRNFLQRRTLHEIYCPFKVSLHHIGNFLVEWPTKVTVSLIRGETVFFEVHIVIMSQSIPSVPGQTLGQIFRNWSNPPEKIFGQMPRSWANSIDQIRGGGRASKFSNVYYLPTLNNHMTLRFQKESFCSRSGRAF